MNTQSETPETNTAWDESCALKKLSDQEKKEFASKLERERNDLRRLVKKLEGQLTSALGEIVNAHDSKQPARETPDKLNI